MGHLSVSVLTHLHSILFYPIHVLGVLHKGCHRWADDREGFFFLFLIFFLPFFFFFYQSF